MNPVPTSHEENSPLIAGVRSRPVRRLRGVVVAASVAWYFIAGFLECLHRQNKKAYRSSAVTQLRVQHLWSYLSMR